MKEILVPPQLAKIADNRDHIQTNEFAHALNKAAQTIRKNYCLTGACYGIVPVKIGNRLLWSVEDIAKLLIAGDVSNA